jgi:hypothetical protein
MGYRLVLWLNGVCTPTTQLALLGFPIAQAFAYFNDLRVSGIVTV